MLEWRDARVMCDDWVYFHPEEKKHYVIMDAMESFHQSLPWSTVPVAGILPQTGRPRALVLAQAKTLASLA